MSLHPLVGFRVEPRGEDLVIELSGTPGPEVGAADPTLRAIVQEHRRHLVGVPVLLFTEAALDPTPTGDVPAIAHVAAVADAVGLDLEGADGGTLELHTREAYLLQAALGEAVLGDADDEDAG